MGMDRATRTIYLGDIDAGAADKFVRSVHVLMSDNDLPITVHLNSHGGLWCDALAIYDVIRDADTQFTVEAAGSCMSAAVPISQAFDYRMIHKHTTVMIHNGTWGAEDHVTNVEAWAKWLRKQRELMYELLASRSHKNADYWRRRCAKGDSIMTAHEAVALGLFDEVIGE